MVEFERRDGVLRLHRPGTRWLSTGWAGGASTGPAAYNVTVPEGWECDAIESYVDTRLADAGFERDGPVLLTGVAQRHARGARHGSVTAVATVGLSNPATLPLDPAADEASATDTPAAEAEPEAGATPDTESDPDQAGDARPAPPGTCNVLVGTRRALQAGALAHLATTVATARTTTLQALAGVPGTSSDAIVVGCDPDGEPARYAGPATAVGDAARACVRDAIAASFASRYPDGEPPAVAGADHGLVTTTRAERFDV
jgi:adenosylcobinamide hydrolase